MSLQLIARDLYRLQQEVDRLENKLAVSPPTKSDGLKRKLASAKVERDLVKRMLDGHLDR